MHVVKKIMDLRQRIAQAKAKDQSVGFVPTMGAFHEGHLSLFRRCKKENALSVASIFVNPLQFGPKEDFLAYPRENKKDISLAKKENVDIMFYPSVREMYPEGNCATSIQVDALTKNLCAKSRPGHFEGVMTVVAKLLNIVSPDALYLGQKDAQQCVVIKQMVKDLNFPVKIKILPTIRESDGLAMSSRNRYLSSQQRKEASFLYQSLAQARKLIKAGERNPQTITGKMQDIIRKNTSGTIDYIECVQADSLKPLATLEGKILVALAVWMGKARLIDNMIFDVK